MESIIEIVSRRSPECVEVEVDPLEDVTDDDLIRLVDALKGNPHVRKIDFYEAPSSRTAAELFRRLGALLRENAVIRSVRLPRGTSNEELLPIAESLGEKNDNATSLTTLDLYHSDVRGHQGGEIIETLLLNNGTLEEINLSYNRNLGPDGAACIARALRSDRCVLKRLDLYECSIGNDGARELSRALGNNNNAALEELRVGNNRITLTGFRYALEMLETNSFLRVLDLAGNNRVDRDFDDGTPGREIVGDLVSRALGRNASLRELNFCWCGLSGTVLSRVFQTLAGDNQTLSRLRLTYSNNCMDEATTNTFARFLPNMKGLEDICFSWYEGISTTVLRGLLEGLRNNKSLVRIETSYDARLGSSAGLWETWSKFVTRRNKMRPLLEGGNGEVPSGGPRAVHRPVPRSLLPHLLTWCGQNGSVEARASLIHHVVRARSNKICGLTSTTTATKRPAPEGA